VGKVTWSLLLKILRERPEGFRVSGPLPARPSIHRVVSEVRSARMVLTGGHPIPSSALGVSNGYRIPLGRPVFTGDAPSPQRPSHER